LLAARLALMAATQGSASGLQEPTLLAAQPTLLLAAHLAPMAATQGSSSEALLEPTEKAMACLGQEFRRTPPSKRRSRRHAEKDAVAFLRSSNYQRITVTLPLHSQTCCRRLSLFPVGSSLALSTGDAGHAA
jgi:hypothetical protein